MMGLAGSEGVLMWSDGELWTVFDYPLADYPFPSLVSDAIEVDDLTAIRTDGPRWTRETDQGSDWHRLFYRAFDGWRETYQRFVREELAPHIGEPFYYQAVPTFRVHQPDNVAVGEFHTDAQYHHPDGEISFWLPLTPAYDTNSVWVADDEDEIHPFVTKPGEVVAFPAVSRRHGNLVNTTGQARVSFDFRCLPVRRLPERSEGRSVNMGMRFVPGEYYHAEVVDPAA